jgi:hypothetical protein
MKFSGPKLLREMNSPGQPPSKTPTAEKSKFLRPADMPYEVPYYAGATLDAPTPSALYQHNSRETWHLRKFAYARACIEGLFAGSPVTERKILKTRFPFHMVIKYGTEIQLSEASTLRFVAQQTSVPVPKVYCAFTHNGMNFILMEHVKGKRLDLGWKKASPAMRKGLLLQLKGYFEEIRNIPHPWPGVICSADGGPLFDRRVEDDMRGFGPFANERDFNNFLRCGITDTYKIQDISFRFNGSTVHEEVEEMITIQDKKKHSICFTHGDAHGGNFLVKGDKITAIIDFEMAGFYPEHWEYTTAMTTGKEYPPRYLIHQWKPELKNVLTEYPEELKGEMIRQDCLDSSIREKIPRADKPQKN